MKPHSWLNWYIPSLCSCKNEQVNIWYLPDPLLGKCGSSIQHLWWNGLYCECSWGKQAEHILHATSGPSILARHSESTRSPPGMSGPIFQAHLISYLSSFAHWVQVTHTLSFPQTPTFSLWAWRTPEFFASSGHISNVSSSERCFRISPTQYS